MNDHTQGAGSISKDDWEQALQVVVHRQITGPGRQAWVTSKAIWVTADKVESGLRHELSWEPGFSRPFGCVEQLMAHGIVPPPRACALLWRRDRNGPSMKQVMMLEIPPRLAKGAFSPSAYWSLDEVDVKHVTYLAILRSDTKVPRGKESPYGSLASSSLAILSPPEYPGKAPSEPHVVLSLFHDPIILGGPGGSSQTAS